MSRVRKLSRAFEGGIIELNALHIGACGPLFGISAYSPVARPGWANGGSTLTGWKGSRPLVYPLPDAEQSQLSTVALDVYRQLEISFFRSDSPLDRSRSGFFLIDDPTGGMGSPKLLHMEVWFARGTCPPLVVNCSDAGEILAAILPLVPGYSAGGPIWQRLAFEPEEQRQALDELRAFILAWRHGESSVEVRLAGGTPYCWTVHSKGKPIWSARRVCFPFWRKRSREILRCADSSTRD